MDLILGFIYALFNVFLISIVLDAPKKSLPLTAVMGAVGWLIYLLGLKFNLNIIVAIFIASLTIMILAHLAARKFKYPTTLFIIACHFPFVPGEAIYRSVFSLLHNDTSLSQYYALRAILIAGSIALSIFIVDTIFFSLKKQK